MLLAFLAPTGSVRNFTPLWAGGLGLSALATAMVSVMWAYDGWADLSFMSGEVKDPSRTLPRALIIGTLAIILIYLLVNVAYMYLVPLPEMAQSRLIASTAAERIPILGQMGAGLISGVVMISTFSSVNGTMMASPRIFFGMADRGLFFKAVARVSPRFQSPSTAIFLATALGVIYVLFNDFQQLADKVVLGISGAAEPARPAEAVPGVRLSGGARDLPVGIYWHDRERARDRSEGDGDYVRDHRGRDPGVLRRASGWADPSGRGETGCLI